MNIMFAQECPVEYEFVKTIQEIENKRTFRVLHGPVLRSGNGPEDFGKPGVDPYKVNNPLLVLKEHIVVNDLRIVDKLKEYDTEEKLEVSQEQFASALEVSVWKMMKIMYLINVSYCCLVIRSIYIMIHVSNMMI